MGTTHAQSVLPRAGESFTFGIIEGPDNLLGDSAQAQTTLQLTITSLYSGCGVLSSPSGFLLDFNFNAGSPTVIELPYNLMQRFDIGKNNKGILLRTSEPVNVMLHDFVLAAGEASQILPDDALDTNYVSFGWGIYDDIFDPEHNVCEFLVTAPQDSTIVTITPSVKTTNDLPAGIPYTVRLDRGESFIVKADTSDRPSDPSLSGSKIVSTKPVSVMVGLTCGYVPLGYESCNELMDELIGKKWWSSHFLVTPLVNHDSAVVMVLTSDRPFFASINNGFSGSSNNRLVAEFTGAAEIQTFDNNGPVLVEAQQLTRGSDLSDDFSGTTDPSVVTVLDTGNYTDTIVWTTPSIGGFENGISVICPTVDLPRATLDGVSLNSLAPSVVINGTGYSAMNALIDPGEHLLISPDPVFGIASGFAQADAYSFMPGTSGPFLPHDTVIHTLILQADSATTCSEFGIDAILNPAISPSGNESLLSFSIPITYDPTTLHLIAVEPHAVLLGSYYSIDTSTPGLITITADGEPNLVGSDLFRLVFEGWKSISATSVGKNTTFTGCGTAVENVTVSSVTFSVQPPHDSLTRTFALAADSASLCTPLSVVLLADSTLGPADDFDLSEIDISFDTAAQTLSSVTPSSLFSQVPIRQTGAVSGNYRLLVTQPIALSGIDTLVRLQLLPKSLTASTTIRAKIYYLRCGDTLSRSVTLVYSIRPILDSTHTTLTVVTSPVSFGNQAFATVKISGLPNTADVKQFDLYTTYNHDVLSFERTDQVNTLTGTWPPPSVSLGVATDTLHFTSPASLGTNGILADLAFETFVSDSMFTPIEVSSSLPGTESGCLAIFSTPPATAMFVGQDLCGDSLMRAFMLGEPILIDAADIQNGDLHLELRTGTSETVTLTLSDMLGRTIWEGQIAVGSTGGAPTEQNVPLPPLASGTYILRLSARGTVVSRTLPVIK